MEPTGVQVPVAGSNTSAESRLSVPLSPPATRTLPVRRRTATGYERASCIDPVAVQAPVPGSYSSAVFNVPPPFPPPATRTRPSWSATVIPLTPRSTDGAPVTVHADADAGLAIAEPEGDGLATGLDGGLEPPPERRSAPPRTSAPMTAAAARRTGMV